MQNIYLKALDLAGYELEGNVSLEVQVRNMFLDMVDGGMYSDIRNEEEVDDLIEEIGIDEVARMLVRSMSGYREFKRMVGIGWNYYWI